MCHEILEFKRANSFVRNRAKTTVGSSLSHLPFLTKLFVRASSNICDLFEVRRVEISTLSWFQESETRGGFPRKFSQGFWKTCGIFCIFYLRPAERVLWNRGRGGVACREGWPVGQWDWVFWISWGLQGGVACGPFLKSRNATVNWYGLLGPI